MYILGPLAQVCAAVARNIMRAWCCYVPQRSSYAPTRSFIRKAVHVFIRIASARFRAPACQVFYAASLDRRAEVVRVDWIVHFLKAVCFFLLFYENLQYKLIFH